MALPGVCIQHQYGLCFFHVAILFHQIGPTLQRIPRRLSDHTSLRDNQAASGGVQIDDAVFIIQHNHGFIHALQHPVAGHRYHIQQPVAKERPTHHQAGDGKGEGR